MGTLYVTTEIQESREFATSQLQTLSQQLANSVNLPLYAESKEILQQYADQTAALPELASVSIFSYDGRLLVRTDKNPTSSGKKNIVLIKEVYSNPLMGTVESTLTGAPPPLPVKLGSIRLERSTNDIAAKSRTLTATIITLSLASWLLLTLATYLLLNHVTASFNALMGGIESMKNEDYSYKIKIDSNDEAGRAAVAINSLANTLHLREEENRKLTDDLILSNKSLKTEIAERIQAELAVRESEQNLESVLNFMPVGVIWYLQDGTIEFQNHFFKERFGYASDEIRNREELLLHAYPDSVYRNQIRLQLEKALEFSDRDKEHTPMFESRFTCKNGSVRHVIAKLAITRKRTILILIDITDRERLQEQFIKTQKLESIGILAGGIAHNFNNALTSVLGFVTLAAKQLDETHKAAPLLQHAEQATKRAAQMAKQLLTFARGGAPAKKQLSVRNLLHETAEMATNGTRVITSINLPDSLHDVIADQDQLTQVFNNIAINAVQSMPDGGRYTITAENVIMNGDFALSSQQSSYVRMTFTDEGRGIPADDLNKVFDPYFTTNPSNTGLGLASVHSIITKHGGQVTLDSVVGRGTTVTLLIPSAGQVSGRDQSASDPSPLRRSETRSVLIMDDEQTVREFARECVTFLGYQATVCADGHEAIAKYREAYQNGSPFMAVILDLNAPNGIGGIEAARQILEIDPNAGLIVSSGYSQDSAMLDYMNHGFCDAIEKPYRANELGEKLNRLLMVNHS